MSSSRSPASLLHELQEIVILAATVYVHVLLHPTRACKLALKAFLFYWGLHTSGATMGKQRVMGILGVRLGDLDI